MKDIQIMDMIEEVEGKDTAWLVSWSKSQAEYNIYMPYVLDELVKRAKERPEIIADLVEILENQTAFHDARKPMPSGAAFQRVFKEGPQELRDAILRKANDWPEQKQEDMIMCGLERERRMHEVARWEAETNFVRKKTRAASS